MQIRKLLPPIGILFRLKTLAFTTFAFLLFNLQACVTDVNAVLPEVPPKLVIAAFISPEGPEIQVSVTRTVALLSAENNGKPKVIADAEVWLADGTDSVKIPFGAQDLYRTSNFPIVAGKTYSLRVTTSAGLAAHASCTVPVKRNQLLTATIDSSTIDPLDPTNIYVAALRWPDLSGEGDFYKVSAAVIYESITNPATDTTNFLEFSDDPLTRDFKADGRSWLVNSLNIVNYKANQRAGKLKYLQAFLLTTDRNYFEYHQSLRRYQSTNSFDDPVRLFSNVQGGLGIFGAYRSYLLQVPLR